MGILGPAEYLFLGPVNAPIINAKAAGHPEPKHFLANRHTSTINFTIQNLLAKKHKSTRSQNMHAAAAAATATAAAAAAAATAPAEIRINVITTTKNKNVNRPTFFHRFEKCIKSV